MCDKCKNVRCDETCETCKTSDNCKYLINFCCTYVRIVIKWRQMRLIRLLRPVRNVRQI